MLVPFVVRDLARSRGLDGGKSCLAAARPRLACVQLNESFDVGHQAEGRELPASAP